MRANDPNYQYLLVVAGRQSDRHRVGTAEMRGFRAPVGGGEHTALTESPY